MLNHKAASVLDGESIEQFTSEMEERVEEICEQLKAGTYRAPPSGVEIPKGWARAERDRWAFRCAVHNAPHTVCVGDAGWR